MSLGGAVKKELSICQSLLCLDLVSFPVLRQIKPQAGGSGDMQPLSAWEEIQMGAPSGLFGDRRALPAYLEKER